MSSRRNHACYQMLSYTGYRFLYFLAKASKHIVAWLSVESLAVWRELFVPAGCAQLSAERGSLLLVFVCMAVAPRSQPLALSIVPTRDTSSPKNWLKSQRGYDLESLALWIRFSAKFLGLMEDGSLGVHAVGWVQWGRIPWQGWHPAVPGDKHHRHLPAQTSPCVLNRTLSSETDFFTASELRLTDRIFYPGEGGKPETRYLPVVFLFFDFLCKTLRCLGNGFPCQMEGYGWKTRRTKTFCSLLP